MKYSAFLLFQFLFFLNCNLLAADSPSMSHMQMNHEHVDKGVFMLSVGIIFVLTAVFSVLFFIFLRKRLITRVKLKEIFKHLPFSFALADKNGNLTYAYSVSSNEIFGKNLADINQDLFAKFKTAISQMGKNSSEKAEFEYDFNGARKVAIISRLPVEIFGEDKFVGASADISETYRNKEKLKKYIEIEEILTSSLALVALNKDHLEVVKRLVDIVKEKTGTDCSFIYEFNYKTMTIDFVSSSRYSTVSDKSQIPYRCNNFSTDNEFYRILARKDAVSLSNLSTLKGTVLEPFFPPEDLPFRSILIEGIWSNEKLVAFIGIDSADGNREFNEIDMRMLNSTAYAIGISLERNSYIDDLQTSESEKSIIMNSMHIPAVLFDIKMNIVESNSAAEGIARSLGNTAFTEDCKCALNMLQCLEAACLFRNCLAAKEQQTAEIRTGDRDYMATCIPIFKKDEMHRILCTLVDITDFNIGKRRMEEAVREEHAASLAKSRFIASMSHEIRTPLNSIIVFSELSMDSSVKRPQCMANLKNIRAAAENLLTLMDDILDLSQLETDKLKIINRPTDMSAIVSSLIKTYSAITAKKGLDYSAEIEGRIPFLSIDGNRLRQVLSGIVGNAVKFTSHGFVKISVSYADNTLFIKVSDSGKGVSEKFISKIFNFFEQEIDLNSNLMQPRSEGGAGLGLAIAKKLVEKMGGEINVESEVGKGSVFTVAIYNVETAEAEEVKNIRDDLPFGSIRSDLSVLIVDDIDMNLKVMSLLFKKLGVECVLCNSAEKALKELETFTPSIIFTDLWMPDCNGDELALKIKSFERFSKTPVIAVTADTQIGARGDVFDSVMFKPLTVSGIRDTIVKFQN